MASYWQTLQESGSVSARLVSDVVSPPLVYMVLGTAIALKNHRDWGQTALWLVVYLGLIAVLPVAYIALQVKRGKISDIHMKERNQRLGPFLVSMASSGVAWALLALWQTPREVWGFPVLAFAQLAVLAVVTLFWQISIHMISVTGGVVAAGILFGWPVGLLFAPLIPLVGWARLRLSRHTPAQVIAGTLAGAALPWLVFAVVNAWPPA
jgi:membrane-associated phospholipid phosphatase